MKIIGVTGSLGTGKTTVAGLFKRLGSYTIDADTIVHALLSGDKDTQKAVRSAFGKSVLRKGRIDRKKLASVVFDSKKELKKLCGIIHPRVIALIKKKIKSVKRTVVVIDAPLLIEAGLHKDMDKVIVVKTGKKTQIARCAELGFSEDEALKRIRNQMPLREKLRLADFVIDNSGTLENTRRQVLKIWRKLGDVSLCYNPLHQNKL